MNKFPVLEIFGPTIQGEGMVVGRKTMFVRTAGCDYSCAWCDSAFTWDGSAKQDIERLTAHEIVDRLIQTGGDQFDHVTISGGNPALLKNLHDLINLLHEKEIEIALETQGSRWQDWFLEIDDLTISPKPPSSKMETNWEALDGIINHLEKEERLRNTSLKVVIFNNEDLKYAEKVHERYPNVPFFLQVGNDDLEEDESSTLASHLLDQYEWLIDQVVASPKLNKVRVLPQVHALVWGNKRGV
ncbi:preQ(0) biosynthesis protein QueE [Halobacillus karajensis]|uniref:7-carboxy-7-deazaguanine synthase n=1 Tax=Halobacillus karajensis TaxID=195088 RepID=A0A024P5S4_9BACI|nr:7-carboxy-7-deazaguanine synthase QueE [Halobacillus karajensis]CDQ20408.1 7-carboxy-7-deazaguanine synthase [Halobacillus karajensis]CDQ24123.1 7-carboxy-7-deazaguanine synthase [Halobacillus karajensis]CDQ27601.1 7-carboxy-7-deazaguanine synthase [Halobacillus karajensis]SEH92126.1 preQ(0) biosynthesis protein QueE [Halobacillus karajensis]